MPLSTATEIAYYVSNNPFDLRTLVLDDRYGVESYSEHGAWILLPNRELIRPELKAFFDPVPGAIAGVGESTDPLPQIQPLARADTEIPSTEPPSDCSESQFTRDDRKRGSPGNPERNKLRRCRRPCAPGA